MQSGALLAKATTGLAAGLFAMAVARLMPTDDAQPAAVAAACIVVGAASDALVPGWLWADGPMLPFTLGRRWRALYNALTWSLLAAVVAVLSSLLLGMGLAVYLVPVAAAAGASLAGPWAQGGDTRFEGRRPPLLRAVMTAMAAAVGVWCVVLGLWGAGWLPMPAELWLGPAIVAGGTLPHDLLSMRAAALPPLATVWGRAAALCVVFLLLPVLVLLP